MVAPTDAGCSKAWWRRSTLSSWRCYVIATGIVFALMFVAHVARVFVEGSGILREPMIIVTSILSLGLAIWAFLLVRRPS